MRVRRRPSVRAQFDYARTIENLRLDCGEDRYASPTTLQFYPHGRAVLLRNFVRYGNYGERFYALRFAIAGRDYWDSLIRLLDASAISDHVVHIWGHSWEIEEHGLWPRLQAFFAVAAALKPEVCTVSDVMSRSEKSL